MIGFGRDKVAKAARELADHLQVIENVKALQSGQKELADAIRSLDDRIKGIEVEIRALKSETALQAIKETQIIVSAVQGSLNQRIENLVVKVAMIENGRADERGWDGKVPQTDAPSRLIGNQKSEK